MRIHDMRLWIVGLTLILLFPLTARSEEDEKSSKKSQDIALIFRIKGSVEIKRDGSEKWEKQVKRGVRLNSGDKLQTKKDGFVVIMFTDDKSQIKMKPDSELHIQGDREKSTIIKRIGVEIGEMLISVDKPKGSLTVETPSAVAAIKGTRFETAVSQDGQTDFIVTEGEIEIDSDNENKTASQNHRAHIDSEGHITLTAISDGQAQQLENSYSTIENGDSKTIRMTFRGPNGELKIVVIEAYQE
ncbi:MAG: hypothetical protein B6244_00170 [Candidatus Cloacimonetes bacterium 4572_55]|nr:MAG: hypothetical protein B6244_00170 [Candidatus Cloacimonetes bacterium 4572_55]